MTDISRVKFNSDGLVPAVVQDAHTREVLMVAYMDREALERTVRGPHAWFFSRSRNELWEKGATSGNYLNVRSVRVDCDADTLLVTAEPAGPACHTGNQTCFFEDPLVGETDADSVLVLEELARVIDQRERERPEGSYTTRLFEEGPPRIAQKVVEEAGEVAIASVAENGGNTAEEVADMLYHTLVLLKATGVSVDDVWAELAKRRR